VYTGGERGVPAEHITSEYIHVKSSDQGFDPQEVRNPNTYDFGVPAEGGVMPIDDVTRETVDKISQDYEVDLDYGEGVVHIRGKREEIEDFVEEICGSGQELEGKNHPHQSISPDAELDTKIIADGGYRKGVPIGGGKTKVYNQESEDKSGIGSIPIKRFFFFKSSSFN
jgi:hypothetical protein